VRSEIGGPWLDSTAPTRNCPSPFQCDSGGPFLDIVQIWLCRLRFAGERASATTCGRARISVERSWSDTSTWRVDIHAKSSRPGSPKVCGEGYRRSTELDGARNTASASVGYIECFEPRGKDAEILLSVDVDKPARRVCRARLAATSRAPAQTLTTSLFRHRRSFASSCLLLATYPLH
jgi:hypothetical protein